MGDLSLELAAMLNIIQDFTRASLHGDIPLLRRDGDLFGVAALYLAFFSGDL